MGRWEYTKGLHDLGTGDGSGSGAWAYLQPDGGWGWSNAGLVIDGAESLLIDTLFDEMLTGEMLDAIREATRLKPGDLTYLVNTHANGDHTFGNRLVTNAEIIATEATAAEMTEAPPDLLAFMVKEAPNMGELGAYFLACFGQFHFEGIELKLPTRTFSGDLTLMVGDKAVHLIEVGPAHTRGDTLVHVPSDRVVYTGDIIFADGTPVMWAGPVSNWIAACERILAMDVDVIVPGHGPITDKAGVRRMRDYLVFLDNEARGRFNAGLSAKEAAHDIALGDYAQWLDAERVAVNVVTLYRTYTDNPTAADPATLFSLMAEMASAQRTTRGSS